MLLTKELLPYDLFSLILAEPVASYKIELLQHFPAPDMHEKEPYELLTTNLEWVNQAVYKAGIKKE